MKKILLSIIALFSLLNFGITAKAQISIDAQLKPEYAATVPTSTDPGSRVAPINIILQLIAGSLIYAAGPIAVLMIAIGGFRYVTSRGDQTAMEGAKKTIMWAIIGLLVIIISYAIVTNIIQIIGTTGTVGGYTEYSPALGF